jgi:NCAIR mutase (PurE)-related protein
VAGEVSAEYARERRLVFFRHGTDPFVFETQEFGFRARAARFDFGNHDSIWCVRLFRVRSSVTLQKPAGYTTISVSKFNDVSRSYNTNGFSNPLSFRADTLRIVTPEQLRLLLSGVAKGSVTPESAFASLQQLPFDDLDFAQLDRQRVARTGIPEVVFAQGKTPEQVAEILLRLAGERPAFATRASHTHFAATVGKVPHARYHEIARIIEVPGTDAARVTLKTGTILVIAAGTSDLPVAEEAAVSATLLGSPVERLYDVGVAGIHRLFAASDRLAAASVRIVVAGMEGALPSVVAGLVGGPVIAVPTSVGYGASFGGIAALLGMLNSCAPGIATVNIDNGFGAAAFAHTVNR